MDPAVVYEELRALNCKMDTMNMKMDKIDRRAAETSGQVNAIAIVQRAIDDTLRKSANSINVIVRIVSGLIGMSSEDLGTLLLEANALLAPVKPKPDRNFELSPLTGYPPMHGLTLMLTELLEIIDKHRLDIVKSQSEIVPITTASSSLPSVSCSTTYTSMSSQNESPVVLPVITEATSVQSLASSQNESPAVLPVTTEATCVESAAASPNESSEMLSNTTEETSMQSSQSNITPFLNCHPNLNTEKTEKEAALRRKYKNKYRYLNVDKKLSIIPKEKIIDKSHIPEPYRNPIFDNVKDLRIMNTRTNKSVIKPLSFFHPCIIINPNDIANCAAVAPRIKNNNENHETRNPSNNHSDYHNECKISNRKRSLRNSKNTKKKKVECRNQALITNKKTLRSTTKNIKCESPLKTKVIFKKPLNKKQKLQ